MCLSVFIYIALDRLSNFYESSWFIIKINIIFFVLSSYDPIKTTGSQFHLFTPCDYDFFAVREKTWNLALPTLFRQSFSYKLLLEITWKVVSINSLGETFLSAVSYLSDYLRLILYLWPELREQLRLCVFLKKVCF